MNIKAKKCDFCQSTEGVSRPIGGFVVELRQVEIDGKNKMACQSCYRFHLETSRIMESKRVNQTTFKNFMQKIKAISVRVFYGLLFTCYFASYAFAQGPPGLPGFPDAPDAAPIDGGLGLLAVAGGAYAWKKLKSKKG
mgnify:CR=1 FL=1|tara:strand:+ start:3767 stop:4180 length:414 start_codon:yes stop_codon:yes gene_type:complete